MQLFGVRCLFERIKNLPEGMKCVRKPKKAMVVTIFFILLSQYYKIIILRSGHKSKNQCVIRRLHNLF